ncbi:hypothetical protein MNBD_PLANCTO02-2237 [hydrothermal vent metagenome]|uniref:RND efflux pump membrane fusion protein barrel-sandwich domain-containing protein n=1 Tax=hydrothermal vent metagenome TaxID=652676 RepID=A0A3B1DZY9_9ZZZZ
MPQSSHSSHVVSSKLRLFVVVAIAGIAGIYVTSIFKGKETTTYKGYLTAETSAVVADRHAAIQQIHVSQGEEVEPQKLIATLIDLEQPQRLLQLKASLQKNKYQIEQAKAQIDIELIWRTRAIDTDLHKTQIEAADFLKKQLNLKMEGLSLNRPLSQNVPGIKQSAFTPLPPEGSRKEPERIELLLRREANKNAIEVVETQFDICEQRIKQLNDLLKSLPQKIERAHNLPSLKKEYAKIQAELSEAEEEKNGIEIRSEAYGTVGVIHKNRGDKVTTGEPLAMLLDQQQRYLVVHVPSTEINKFTSRHKEQKKLTLTFPGGIICTGVVHSIPPQAEKMKEGNSASLQIVKVRVTPFGKSWPQLPIGSQVNVQLQK